MPAASENLISQQSNNRHKTGSKQNEVFIKQLNLAEALVNGPAVVIEPKKEVRRIRELASHQNRSKAAKQR